MTYSYPVYRLGMIFSTKENVSVTDAGAIAAEIVKHANDWDRVFKKAAVLDNHASGFRTDKAQTISQRVRESFIFNFPAIRFRMAAYSVDSRISVTVCQHGHQSKIWLKLTCTAVNKRPAVDLTVRTVERYFSMAEEKARSVLPALASEYLEYVRRAGGTVPESEPYYLQLRAFNSLTPSSAELRSKLDGRLSVREALTTKEYRAELLEYFRIVLGGETTPEKISREIEKGALDVFGYKSPDHEALFSIRTDEGEADICGYGYDSTRKVGNDLLAQATTRDLLNEYAKEL